MSKNKYGLSYAVRVCFRHAPGASVVKLLVEAINGALAPLMVVVVASFIDSAVNLVKSGGSVIGRVAHVTPLVVANETLNAAGPMTPLIVANATINVASLVTPLVVALVLMAAIYAYTQLSQIIVRLSDVALANALRENLRTQMIQKQSRISYALLEDPDTLDLITRVCSGAESSIAAIFNSGLRIVRLAIQAFGILSLLAAHVWQLLPLFVVSAAPIALIARKGGKAIYESDKVTTKLTRRHYYLSSILTGRDAAAERTLFGYTGKINADFSATHLKRSNMVTKEIAVEEITVNACGLILNVLVVVAAFALLKPAGVAGGVELGSAQGAVSHGLYVSLVGALIGLARMLTGGVSGLVSDATGQAEYMRNYTHFFALQEDSAGVGAIAYTDAYTANGAGENPLGNAGGGPEFNKGRSLLGKTQACPANGVDAYTENTVGGITLGSAGVSPVNNTFVLRTGECGAPAIFNSLEILGLRFRYTPSSPYVLDGVNLALAGGKSYSLIGRNGAGKSTLVKILLGLYRDYEGTILINGKDIFTYSAEELRGFFSVIYQDFAKYYITLGGNITFKGNVTYGGSDVIGGNIIFDNDRSDLDNALRLAELDGVVAKLPLGVDTPLGKIFEGGIDISGGEWQRIAIARALYANAPFMILDEPTANLSPMAESRLYGRFAEIAKGKTSLLISHRLGSTKLSGTLFVLDGGVIAESGSHDELMAASGVYAEMFVSQKDWYDGQGMDGE